MAENKNKRRVSVTAVDLIIIAALLLTGFFTYRYVFSDPVGETFELDYVVKVSAVRSELSEKIAVGDEVYSEDGAYMGRVTAYESRGAVMGTTGQTIPDRSDLQITIEAVADSGGLVSGNEIYVGRELSMYTTGLFFEGVCISVR